MKSALSSPLTFLRRRAWYILPLMVSVGAMTLAIARPSMAQAEVVRMLTVSGQGMESIPTTLTRVYLGVEVQGRTAADAQQEAAEKSSSLVAFLRSRNVQELETTGINLSPRYDYSSDTQRLVGYTATNTVTFEIPTEDIGDLLDQAVNAGATRIDSISFTAEDAAIDAAQQEALRDATEDALAQADAVLSALGLTRQEVIGIQVNGATPPVPPIPYPMPMAEAAFSRDAAVTPVIGGEQDVNASVTLQIRY